jgi:hypothetical protein
VQANWFDYRKIKARRFALDRLMRAMKVYNMRDHLARYPKDLLRLWWDEEGDLPRVTSSRAYQRYANGEPPRRKLYKEPCEGYGFKPKLRVIEGGK